MEKKDKSSLDEFWDIDKLLPQKNKTTVFSSHTYDTAPVEVILKAKERTADNKLKTIEMRPSDEGERKLSFVGVTPEPKVPAIEYSPDNPFIKNVKIYKRENFAYYAAFYEEGTKYLDADAPKCLEPSFFSYVPQYSQLDPEQLEFYIYMRGEIRQKNAISASYSYILLYIFELINVEPNKEKALDQLCYVWQSYRMKYPKLDALLKEWISDFCLIHNMSPTAEMLGSAYKTAIESANLKELYICGGKSKKEIYSDGELALALLSLCSNYDWKKSKYAVDDNIPLYNKYIKGALIRVLSVLGANGSVFVGAGELKREAFAGAVCVPQMKFRIEVSYCSISRSHEMRFLISDVVKHTENRIRAYLGIKSRLTVYSLPVNIRKCIDEYMDGELGGKNARKKVEEKHDYDKLYDLPKREFSLDAAKKIEEASWQTTNILIEAFEDDKEDVTQLADVSLPKIAPSNNCDEDKLEDALTPFMEFIRAALKEDSVDQNRIAAEKGRMLDSLADEINELAAENYGDIILEKNGEYYCVIEDYKEMFE
ncbi:MAG: TerB N-terminal domain-containing protein [Clostridia bacterium]|nr:TerB N-terminal domain-containing protein [Clostridia bacterium]